MMYVYDQDAVDDQDYHEDECDEDVDGSGGD